MKKFFFGSLTVIAALFLSLSACNKGGGDEIVIGEYESLTGSEATFGISSTNGLKLAVEEINNSGGLLNKKIKLITYDDQGKPSEAQTVVQRLIKNDNVVAVIGEVASSRSKAVALPLRGRAACGHAARGCSKKVHRRVCPSGVLVGPFDG